MNKFEKKRLTAQEIAFDIGAEIVGDESVEISSVNSLSEAASDEISFISDPKEFAKAIGSKAGAILVKESVESIPNCQLVVEDVDAALIETLNLFAPKLTVQQGIHPTAIIEDSAQIGENVSIAPYSIISHNVKIGANTRIGSGCSVGENSQIGANTVLDNNIAIYRNCSIGNNCRIQSNTTIGSIGFGYVPVGGMPKLVPHNGGVIIEDCVEIGANCCVDRAKFGNTIVGAGTKTDDLVLIAHNAIIGKCCLIAGQSAVAGSAKVGNGVIIGGQSGIADHRTIGDGCMIGAKTAVFQDWPAGSVLMGTPADEVKSKRRQFVLIKRLPQMADQLKDIIKRVGKLEASKNDKE